MEIKYPIIIILVIIGIIAILYLVKNKKGTFISGSKIANTEYIKNTDYYKKKLKMYKLLITALKACCIVAILTSSILIARMVRVETTYEDEYNRDIYLCMDASASVDELNEQIVTNLKETVKSLKGERFGISIFNTTSVTLSPLTDDYEYVLSVLEQLEKAYKDVNSDIDNQSDDYFYNRNYLMSGTIEDYQNRGSSLIGDGLASCVFSFPHLEEKRTRIIIFTTDNDLAGTPLVTLDKAAQIAKDKEIKVFGVGPTLMDNKDRIELKNAVELTSGKYYDQSSSNVKSIVNDIESTSKSKLKGQMQTKQIDIPEVPFAILLIAIIGIIILDKKVLG